MLLEEAKRLLKKTTINEEQLEAVNALYIALDVDKDIFCKMVDAVGLECLIKKQSYYEWVLQAIDDKRKTERYLSAKRQLSELEQEKQNLHKIIDEYEQNRI